eukprot:COSAG02_NODE_12509_length_1535_cov_0.991643_4_plen_235_part_00
MEGRNWMYAGVFMSLVAAVIVLAVLLANAPRGNPNVPEFSDVVKTKLGSVKGTILQDGTRQFLGVPYADSTRFKPARPVKPWGPAVKDCTGALPTPVCFQPGATNKSQATVPTIMTEDCLVLNIHTPESRSVDALHGYPVMVWLHGGDFKHGSGVQYNGSTLVTADSDHPVVVVTINYRLGAFGFFSSSEIGEEDPSWLSYGGMNGIYDQMVALRWSKPTPIITSTDMMPTVAE